MYPQAQIFLSFIVFTKSVHSLVSHSSTVERNCVQLPQAALEYKQEVGWTPTSYVGLLISQCWDKTSPQAASLFVPAATKTASFVPQAHVCSWSVGGPPVHTARQSEQPVPQRKAPKLSSPLVPSISRVLKGSSVFTSVPPQVYVFDGKIIKSSVHLTCSP